MSNIFVGLRKLLPPSPVLIGTVLEIHEEDDTSTVELPTNQGIFSYSAELSSGSRIRARGTFVPVGGKAFVRDGVIETRAPDGDPIEFEVGMVVQEASGDFIFDTFSTDGLLPAREGEIGAEWGPPPGSPANAIEVADGVLYLPSEAPDVTMSASADPSGQSDSPTKNAYFEFEALLNDDVVGADGYASFTVTTSGVAFFNGDHVVQLWRRRSYSHGHWALSAYSSFEEEDPPFDALFGTITGVPGSWGMLPIQSSALFQPGVPVKVRLEWRDSGRDVRLYVNDALLANRADMGPGQFQKPRLLLSRGEDGGLAGDSIRVNYFKAGYLPAGPGPAAGDPVDPGAPLSPVQQDFVVSYGIGGSAAADLVVAYSILANVTWAAVAPSSTPQVSSSIDGADWTSRTASAASAWQSVAYGNGTFVAVNNNVQPATFMTSPDGVTWTTRNGANTTTGWTSVTFVNGLFIACRSTSGTNSLQTSPDGINWTMRTTPTFAPGRAAYGAGLFVVISSSGSNTLRVITSPDGVTWTSRATPNLTRAWVGVAYSATLGLFAAVAATAASNNVMTSPDGITWTAGTTSDAAADWIDLCVGPSGHFVGIGFNSAKVLKSSDGTTWTVSSPAELGASGWRKLAYDSAGSRIAAVANNGRIRYSNDGGTTWTAATGGIGGLWNGVACG